MDSGKVLLIINPVAGHRAARRALYPLVQRLCEGGQMATVYATSAPARRAAWRRRAAATLRA